MTRPPRAVHRRLLTRQRARGTAGAAWTPHSAAPSSARAGWTSAWHVGQSRTRSRRRVRFPGRRFSTGTTWWYSMRPARSSLSRRLESNPHAWQASVPVAATWGGTYVRGKRPRPGGQSQNDSRSATTLRRSMRYAYACRDRVADGRETHRTSGERRRDRCARRRVCRIERRVASMGRPPEARQA
jgi:hypothetical protein